MQFEELKIRAIANQDNLNSTDKYESLPTNQRLLIAIAGIPGSGS
jgi:hypothetical protein